MNDPFAPVPPGTEGMVELVDDAGSIHMKWDNGRTLALIPGEDSFTVISQPIHLLKLYMPLAVKLYKRNEYGSLDDDPIELGGREVLEYEDSIFSAVLRERMPDESERGLMQYYGENDSLNQKVQSYVFTVEKVNGSLMGVAECRIQGDLTDNELGMLKDTVSGQASDGFGEGFEQRFIKIPDGEICVSLWSSEKSWSIQTQDELADQEQQMGGMTLG
ncbi:DUF4314 domain-containing protein [Clostridium sp. HBUAS56010]|uniref:DUF4314 domain-containing protein n=1 Tax=Clostridium sp. HBUAS56010 TaxID=2571127 RepID=UPI001FAAC352|nr:DUF4314 domain-containing protein [Clostridium sp. HBUAS56010]